MSDYDGNRHELLNKILHTSQPSSQIHINQMIVFFSKCVDDIIISINNHAETTSKLKRTVFWLNVVLSVATAIIALTGILTLIITYCF